MAWIRIVSQFGTAAGHRGGRLLRLVAEEVAMQGRGLTITAIVLAILAGVLWWSNREKAKEASKPPADASPKILSLSGSDVQKI